MSGIPYLTLVTFLPVLGMVIILLINSEKTKLIKIVSAIITLLQVVIAGIKIGRAHV